MPGASGILHGTRPKAIPPALGLRPSTLPVGVLLPLPWPRPWKVYPWESLALLVISRPSANLFHSLGLQV